MTPESPTPDHDLAKSAAAAFGRLGGSVKSEAKAAAARKNARLGGLAKSANRAKASAENGKKGGRPRKPRPEA